MNGVEWFRFNLKLQDYFMFKCVCSNNMQIWKSTQHLRVLTVGVIFSVEQTLQFGENHRFVQRLIVRISNQWVLKLVSAATHCTHFLLPIRREFSASLLKRNFIYSTSETSCSVYMHSHTSTHTTHMHAHTHIHSSEKCN